MAKITYDTELRTFEGDLTDLRKYEGRVLLVVNTASHCGFTPQFKGLEQLHQEYGAHGLSVLGVPSNSFMQESRDTSVTEDVSRVRYGVTFDLSETSPVNGPGTHPLFVELKAGARGFAGMKRIAWNFTKFLVGRDGSILKRYSPKTDPRTLVADITQALET